MTESNYRKRLREHFLNEDYVSPFPKKGKVVSVRKLIKEIERHAKQKRKGSST
jgi:hypothetical protein